MADGRMFAQATQLDLPNPTHAVRGLNAYPPRNPRTTPMPRPRAHPPVLTTSALLLALLAPLALADQTLRVVT